MNKLFGFVLEDFPLVEPGDSIARTIIEKSRDNGTNLEDGDVIVVAQKIISKSEDRIVNLRSISPSERSKEISKLTGKDPRLVELILSETESVLKVSPEVLLAEDKRGLVSINAGIDKSNVKGQENFSLLPEDPDQSARKCRREIMQCTGKNVGVIICDTYSRPFRRGQVNFAIGTAGMKLFNDYRGEEDLFHQVLRVKNTAIVDEIAAAAELLMGQAREAKPVVIFRGLGEWVLPPNADGYDITDLKISAEQDLFTGSL